MSFLTPPSPREQKENWASVAKNGKRYFIAFLIPFLLMLWGAGYGQGFLAGVDHATKTEIKTKESSNAK